MTSPHHRVTPHFARSAFRIIGGPRAAGLLLLVTTAANVMGREPLPQDSAATSVTEAPPTPFERTLVGLSEIAQVAIDQAVTKACRKRAVPDAQRQTVRDVLIAQWQTLMDPRDPLVQALMTGYMDLRTGDAPPSPKQLREWGQWAGELYDRHRHRLQTKKAALGGDLGDAERERLEIEIAVMGALSDMSQSHVERWRRGEFTENELWHPLAPPPRSMPAPDEGALHDVTPRTAAPTVPADPIALELSAWSAYVADFIHRFRLDQGQRDAAHSCLSELTARAGQHRERYRTELAELERRIQAPATSPEIEERITRDIVRLYGPIDDMFAELRARLEHLPTGKQREASERIDVRPTPDP